MTPNQHRVFNFIRQYIADNGRSPSYRDIQSNLGVKSTSQIYQIVSVLEAKGKIKRRLWSHRGIELVTDKCPTCGRAA